MMTDILAVLREDRPLVFGHRGAMAYAPMNTIAAFELAAEQGAHGIEFDVQRSKDGHAVVLHDFTVNATTDGSGTVTEKTLAELKMLDAGVWFDARFTGERIPTLDEVFEAVGRRLWLNIEIKSDSAETDGVEQVVADCIVRHQMQQRVLVSSFNPAVLRRFRVIMPDVAIGFLYYPDALVDTRPLVADLLYEAYHPYHAVIDEVLMQQARDAGHIVNTWTVNDPDDARRLRDLGVAAIITNTPDVLLKALR